MRIAPLCVAAAALFLSACNQEQTGETAANESTALTAERIGGGNDTTAIDAVTGDAANMAADVNYTFNDVGNIGEDGNGIANAGANVASNRAAD